MAPQKASFWIVSCATLPTLVPFLPPSRSGLHWLDTIEMWNALSIWHICPPEVWTSSFSEYSPLDLVLTLLLGEMLDVTRYGPNGGKLSRICQGLYVWSTRTKQILRFDCHSIRNSNAKPYVMTQLLGLVSCNIPVMCWDEHQQKSFPSKNFLFISIKRATSDVVHFNVCLPTNIEHWTNLPQIAGPLESHAICSYMQ